MQSVSNRQVMLIGTTYTLISALFNVQTNMVWYAKQHLWVSNLIAGAALLGPLLMLCAVLARFPGKDLFEALAHRLPVVGRLIGLLYVLFFFYILVRDIRMTVDFTNVVLLPRTPLGVTAALVVLAVIAVSYGGVEILARATEVYNITLTAVIFLMTFILFREFDLSYMMPLFNFDVPGILAGGWLISPYIGEIVALAFLFTNQSLRPSNAFRALFIGTATLVTLSIQSLLILGIPIISRVMYSNYELARQLRITDFLDRFDLLLVGLWLPTMMTKIGYNLYFVCHGLRRIVPRVSGQRLVGPVGMLAFVCTFWFFQSSIQLFDANRTLPFLSLWFQLVIPIALFALLRPKKEQAAPPPGAQSDEPPAQPPGTVGTAATPSPEIPSAGALHTK